MSKHVMSLVSLVPTTDVMTYQSTVKPVCNDHLYNKIYYLWFIQ